MQLEYDIRDDKTAVITRIPQPEAVIVLPSFVEGCPVTEIGTDVISLGKKSIAREIVLPETLIKISERAFTDLRYLKSSPPRRFERNCRLRHLYLSRSDRALHPRLRGDFLDNVLSATCMNTPELISSTTSLCCVKKDSQAEKYAKSRKSFIATYDGIQRQMHFRAICRFHVMIPVIIFFLYPCYSFESRRIHRTRRHPVFRFP